MEGRIIDNIWKCYADIFNMSILNDHRKWKKRIFRAATTCDKRSRTSRPLGFCKSFHPDSRSHDHSHSHSHHPSPISDGHNHSHSHHHHHGHGDNSMMGQDEFDKQETAKTWVADPMIVFLNEKLAGVFFEKFQSLLNPKETSVLDFGCGVGHLTKSVSPQVASVTGVDVSQSMIDMYRKQDYSNSKAFCLNMTELHPHHLEGDQFDFIVSFYVLHHIEDPGKMVKVLSSYLKPGGKLVFGEFVPEEPSHFFKPGQLTGWLKDADLENVSEDVALDLKPEEIPKSNISQGNDNMKQFIRIVLGQGTKRA
jgi:2-polyprenyl-3-methyl-5-hydroxy-6-metoxy-1,4-benzoquinol methylase